MPRGAWGRFRTSTLVRDHLIEVEDSIYGTWKYILSQLEGTTYSKPTYSTLRVLFYILRKLKLIEKVGSEKSSRKGYFNKALYRVVESRKNSQLWLNPYEGYYNPSAFRKRVHLTFE